MGEMGGSELTLSFCATSLLGKRHSVSLGSVATTRSRRDPDALSRKSKSASAGGCWEVIGEMIGEVIREVFREVIREVFREVIREVFREVIGQVIGQVTRQVIRQVIGR